MTPCLWRGTRRTDPVLAKEKKLKPLGLSPLIRRGVLAGRKESQDLAEGPQASCDGDLCLAWAVARWAQSQFSRA